MKVIVCAVCLVICLLISSCGDKPKSKFKCAACGLEYTKCSDCILGPGDHKLHPPKHLGCKEEILPKDIELKETEPFRVIPISGRGGYSNFESVVISSQNEMETFMQGVFRTQSWARDGLGKAVADASLDFSKESLVLLRHTEASGSIKVTFSKPILKGQTVVCEIDRDVPNHGIKADMAYYCFALAVSKSVVQTVELHVKGRKPVSFSIPSKG